VRVRIVDICARVTERLTDRDSETDWLTGGIHTHARARGDAEREKKTKLDPQT
jgi:hypothetical protein